jgi:hypothetical protein
MYLTKEKPKTSLYKDYEPRFPKHKDVEIQAYVAYTVGNDIGAPFSVPDLSDAFSATVPAV